MSDAGRRSFSFLQFGTRCSCDGPVLACSHLNSPPIPDIAPAIQRQLRAAYTARLISIYERAVRKLKARAHVWASYLAWCRQRGMRVVGGRVRARALAMHPTSMLFWIDAADEELNANGSVTAARALLQRALAINAPPPPPALTSERTAAQKAGFTSYEENMQDPPRKKHKGNGKAKATSAPSSSSASAATTSVSAEATLMSLAIPFHAVSYPTQGEQNDTRESSYLCLALEYVRMELVFMERLRRRWAILGIDAEAAATGSASAQEELAKKAADLADGAAAAERSEDVGTEEDEEEAIRMAGGVPSGDKAGSLPQDGGEEGDKEVLNSLTAARKRAEASRASAAAQLPVLQGAIVKIALKSAVEGIKLPAAASPAILADSRSTTLRDALGYRFAFLCAVRELLYSFPFANDASTGSAASARKSSGQALRDALVGETHALMRSHVVHFAGASPELAAPRISALAEVEFSVRCTDVLRAKSTWWEDEEALGVEMESGELLRAASRLRSGSVYPDDASELIKLFRYRSSLSQQAASPGTGIESANATKALLVADAEAACEARSREDETLPSDLLNLFKQVTELASSLASPQDSSDARLGKALAGHLVALFVRSMHPITSSYHNEAVVELAQGLGTQAFDEAKRKGYLTYEITDGFFELFVEDIIDDETIYRPTFREKFDKRVLGGLDLCKKAMQATPFPEDRRTAEECRDRLWKHRITLLLEDAPCKSEYFDLGEVSMWDRSETRKTEAIYADLFAKAEPALAECPEGPDVWKGVITLAARSLCHMEPDLLQWGRDSLDKILTASRRSLRQAPDVSTRQRRQAMHNELASYTIAAVFIYHRIYEQNSAKQSRATRQMLEGLLLNDTEITSPSVWLELAPSSSHDGLDEPLMKPAMPEAFRKALATSRNDADSFVTVRQAWLQYLVYGHCDIVKAQAEFESARREAKDFGDWVLAELEGRWKATFE